MTQANGPEPPTATNAPSPRRSKTKRFWNWKLIGVDAILIGVGFYAFLTRAPRAPGMAGLVVGVFGLWLLYRELGGLSINDQVMSMPTGRPQWLPLLSFGRRKIDPGGLVEMTVTPTWLGFHIVWISGDFGTDALVFQSRRQRLRFMAAVEEICPNIQVFRSQRLARR